MAIGGKTTNTMQEVLKSILGDLSQAKTLPDADLQFIVDLETTILSKLREPLDNAAGQMGPGQGPSTPPMPGMPPGGMPGMPPGMAPSMPPGGMLPMPSMGPAEGVPGLRQQPPMPGSPDELARLLG